MSARQWYRYHHLFRDILLAAAIGQAAEAEWWADVIDQWKYQDAAQPADPRFDGAWTAGEVREPAPAAVAAGAGLCLSHLAVTSR
jgi:hypothetical protein